MAAGLLRAIYLSGQKEIGAEHYDAKHFGMRLVRGIVTLIAGLVLFVAASMLIMAIDNPH
jgi:hypothetical protein